MTVDVRHGDCREVIKTLADDSIHACVTDPPYSLVQNSRNGSRQPGDMQTPYGRSGPSKQRGFMGKQWDTGETAFDPAFWAEVYRVLKPGAHLIAFGGTRTYHRLACAIEDAGFEIRDQIGWLYGSGFPKSHNVAVAIDKQAGVPPRGKAFNMKGRGDRADELDANGREFPPPYEATTDSARQWEGWGTALKPAWEPVVLARKPLIGTVAGNVLAHGTGALNIDASRVSTDGETITPNVRDPRQNNEGWVRPWMDDQDKVRDGQMAAYERMQSKGRWPANIIHDGSEEVIAAFPETEAGSDAVRVNRVKTQFGFGDGKPEGRLSHGHSDAGGSAARFFYTSKADAADRLSSKHPTVKPVDLMAYLVRLVTPPGGTVLDPFAGSGTTGMACMRGGFDCILIEREAEYVADIKARLAHVHGNDLPLFADPPLTRAELDADARGNYELALEELRRR